MTIDEFATLQKGDIIELVEGRLDYCHYDTILGVRDADVGRQLMVDYVEIYPVLDCWVCYTYLIYNNQLHKNTDRDHNYYIIKEKYAPRFKLVKDT